MFYKVGKIIFGGLFIAAGLYHFIRPEFFMRIVPPYLPFHYPLVLISGMAELLLGIGLLIPKTSRPAAWGLIALLTAVFPANIHMAMNPDLYSDIHPIVLWLRLPLQGLLMLWAFKYTRIHPPTTEVAKT